MREDRPHSAGPTGSPARSRVGQARETVRTAKAIAAFGAAGAFLGVVALAQHGHPGSTGDGGTGSLQAPTSFEEQLAQDGFFGQGALGPSTQGAAPPAATHTS